MSETKEVNETKKSRAKILDSVAVNAVLFLVLGQLFGALLFVLLPAMISAKSTATVFLALPVTVCAGIVLLNAMSNRLKKIFNKKEETKGE